MIDYIDRQIAIDEAYPIYIDGESFDVVQVETLMGMPSADVQPVRHGHWIIKDNSGTGWYRVTCSECGEDVTSVVPVIGFFPNAKVIWNYCPECGARMDGE